ncbi:hypothetical protein EB796_001672 [Bugula neritina]|uniref:Uncharacterized protein n=1 Tax=Bugula neritina TaxID=10212 RepID=A0A7J7KPE6_BUGNE|nr:hypothetical protein EB796_001672 [Bugula neritina]
MLQSHPIHPLSSRPPPQTKQQEEYARKLYALRDALKSDVFVGFGKCTERYELYTEDRPITPIKLLEIDPSLDWSGDFPSNYSENEGKEFGDDVVFKSIQSMSELLTRS